MLFADKNLKSLGTTIYRDLKLFCLWLDANKLTLNVKKSNYVIFRPREKRLNYHITLMVTDNSTNGYTPLECKDFVKYLGLFNSYSMSGRWL